MKPIALCLIWFSTALGNLTLSYVIHQTPNSSETHASTVALVISNWEISVVSVSTFAGGEDRSESCVSVPSYQFIKSINLTCSNLDYNTLYDISVETLVKLVNETYLLKFSILFSTEDNIPTHSSKLCIYIICKCTLIIFSRMAAPSVVDVFHI